MYGSAADRCSGPRFQEITFPVRLVCGFHFWHDFRARCHGTLGLLWKRVDKITSLDTKIDNEALALALQSQVSFTNVEWDELKVHDTVICTSYISSGKLFFKPALPEKPAGTVGGSESEIAGSLVRDFRTATEYGGVPKFLGRLRNRGHRLIARWGEEILLKTSGNQKTWSLIWGWEQWQTSCCLCIPHACVHVFSSMLLLQSTILISWPMM